MSRGGYQRPSNPAPVSGPGALSGRTDGGPGGKQAMRDLPNAKYGENAEFRADESGAPMAAAPSLPAPGGAPTSPPGAPDSGHPMGGPPPPLSSGTLNPNEPVTAGAPAGPGPMSMQLPAGQQYATVGQKLASLAAISGNPDIQFLAGLAGKGRF